VKKKKREKVVRGEFDTHHQRFVNGGGDVEEILRKRYYHGGGV